MVMSLVAIGVVALIGYMWVLRGFFSAFIHLLCTIAAGAVAFASFEKVAHVFLDSAPTSGFGAILGDSAYALGLMLPFAISLLAFRLLADGLIRANLKFATAADYVGGGLCGAVAGVISAGIMVLSMGFMRLDPEMLGYQPLTQSNQGTIERTGGLLLPVDKWTVKFYGYLSRNAMVDDDAESLGRNYPNLHEMPGAMRMAAFEGAARNTVRRNDVELVGGYRIGKSSTLPIDQLLSDQWNAAPQRTTDLDKNPFPNGSYIVGLQLKFNSGAKERGGDNKILFTNSQVWLVVEDQAGEQSETVYPIAATAQAEAATPVRVRYRFDARETPMASTGGASSATFDLDFVVPANHKPVALFVKGARYPITEASPILANMSSPAERDAMITGGIAQTIELDRGSSVALTGQSPGAGQAPLVDGLRASNTIGRTISKTVLRTIEVDDKNRINEGQQTLTGDDLKVATTEKPLRVEQFAVTPDTVIVQLDVSPRSAMSLLGEVAKSAEDIAPLRLVDTNGTSYEPVGFIHDDAIKNQKTIRFTPNAPVRALKEVPSLSRTRPDDKLVLIFRVSLGVTLKEFAIGNKVVVTFPNIKVDQRQGDR